MIELYMVRHCEAQGNIDRVFHGRTDSDITPKGREQLALLSARFADIHIDRIISSPLRRTLLTAEVVKGGRDIEIETDPRLIEISVSEWEGVPFAQMPVDFPKLNGHWTKTPWLMKSAGGESMEDVFARVSAALMEVAEQNEGKTVVVVSHGCAIRNMLCFLKGLHISCLNEVEWCDNTAVSHAVYRNGRFEVLMENDGSHLSNELSTIRHQDWWKKRNGERF